MKNTYRLSPTVTTRKKLRAEQTPKPKSIGPMRFYLLLTVIVSAGMLLVQMHIVEHHVVENYDLIAETSSFFSRSSTRGSRKNQNVLSTTKDSPTKEKDECDTMVDNESDTDEDLKPILKILCKGGYDISSTSKTVDRSVLPKWSEILGFYGPPKILGLETCPIYRNKTKREDRHVAPAGMFNTGTNLLDNIIYDNCEFGKQNFDFYHSTYQVPWGKHIPFSNRANHTAYSSSKSNRWESMVYTNTLPVVAVRDPYTWMQSMCLQPYGAQFEHAKTSCPNIAPYESDMKAHPRFRKMKHIPVNVKYAKEIKIKYESLAHFWNEWYSEYIEIDHESNHQTTSMKSPKDFPFIVVRLEDLIFHAHTVIPKICECGGGTVKEGKIKQTSKIANGHNKAVDTSSGLNSGLLRSIVKYGNITRRRDGYPKFQLEAAKESLDPSLMDLLGYPYEEY